jgi:hypothetical protein
MALRYTVSLSLFFDKCYIFLDFLPKELQEEKENFWHIAATLLYIVHGGQGARCGNSTGPSEMGRVLPYTHHARVSVPWGPMNCCRLLADIIDTPLDLHLCGSCQRVWSLCSYKMGWKIYFLVLGCSLCESLFFISFFD